MDNNIKKVLEKVDSLDFDDVIFIKNNLKRDNFSKKYSESNELFINNISNIRIFRDDFIWAEKDAKYFAVYEGAGGEDSIMIEWISDYLRRKGYIERANNIVSEKDGKKTFCFSSGYFSDEEAKNLGFYFELDDTASIGPCSLDIYFKDINALKDCLSFILKNYSSILSLV